MNDCISRQAVLGLAEKGILVGNHNYKSVCNAINELPSAIPTERTGHWLQLDYQRGKFECSECHTQGYVNTCMYEPSWNYCPNCGAKMIESQESEE